jgi:hypothetical protein
MVVQGRFKEYLLVITKILQFPLRQPSSCPVPGILVFNDLKFEAHNLILKQLYNFIAGRQSVSKKVVRIFLIGQLVQSWDKDTLDLLEQQLNWLASAIPVHIVSSVRNRREPFFPTPRLSKMLLQGQFHLHANPCRVTIEGCPIVLTSGENLSDLLLNAALT